jgi:hypothetical protein
VTRREVFDKVKEHLLAQGRRAQASGAGLNCAYRNEEGLKCAVGCLIADEHYGSFLEGRALVGGASCVVAAALRKSGAQEDAFPMLIRLQQLHDNQLVETWGSELETIEKEFLG